MKKFILSAAAVAAFSIGGVGVAQADVIDSVGNTISRIFGVPYIAAPSGAPAGSIHIDANGRRFQVDASGRYVPLDAYGSYRDQWGRTVFMGANNQPAYIEQNGQLIPYGNVAGNYAAAPSYDNDGDGIANQYDRAPYDARYR